MKRTHLVRRTVAAVLLALLATEAQAGSTPEAKCQATKNKAVGKYASCRAKAQQKLVGTAGTCSLTSATICYRDAECPPGETCTKDFTKYDDRILVCDTKLADKWTSLEQKAVAAGTTCPTTSDLTDMQSYTIAYSDAVAAALDSGSLPRCGDDVVNVAGEQCDGPELDGETCASLGLADGTLACVACRFDVSGCSAGCTPGCQNGEQDGDETDIDCGASCGATCTTGQLCSGNGDCVSQNCIGGVCQAPTCVDGIENGNETDIDCGGSCGATCDIGDTCLVNADCVTTSCNGSQCEASCTNGVQDGSETDIDCGGSCTACGDCQGCLVNADCAGGSCPSGMCEDAPLSSVVEDVGGATINAYVRGDGAILLAHYGAGARHSTFDTSTPQITTTDGGETPPAGWAPTPVCNSGHLTYTNWNPSGREVIIECGPAPGTLDATVTSTALFADFNDGTKGTEGTVANPGWGMIATIGSGQGRVNHASCGTTLESTTGGVAYCSGFGASSSFANHLASYFTTNTNDSPYVGCAGTGCNGPTCNLQVWVWLK